MALLQAHRIAADKAMAELPSYAQGPNISFYDLWADIHFFLISVGNVKKLLEEPDKHFDNDFKNVLKAMTDKYRSFLKDAYTIRGTYEHLHSCLRLGKENIYSGKMLDDNWNFEICGKQVNVEPSAAIRTLIELYGDLEKALDRVYPPSDKSNGPK